MKSIFNYLIDLFKGIKSLFLGLMVTGSYFFRPWKIVTQKYPENRKTLKMFDRFKGQLIMIKKSDGSSECNACGICELNCPNKSIEIVSISIDTEDGKKKKILGRYLYHHGMCSFCAMCVKSCPSKVLGFSQEFEHSVFDRNKLDKILYNKESVKC